MHCVGWIMFSRSALVLAPALLLCVTGCEKYRAKPLHAERTFNDVERQRRLLTTARDADAPGSTAEVVPASQPFTFMRAVELMRAHSPSLKEVNAEYQARLALSKVKSPLPNPAFEAGPSYSFGPDVGNLYRAQPFASIGFTIPTGKRLKRQDELNRANAEVAFAEASIRYRELYLELRESYSELAIAKLRVELRAKIANSAAQSTAASKKLIEAGFASALDAGLIELEQARLKTEELSAGADVEAARAQLAALTGVSAEHLEPVPSPALPELPSSPPDLQELKQLLVHNHPELARLRAKYEVAERSLRLEIARQYPDFHIGPGFERDGGEKKSSLGLTLGIDLPIFDRNQQGVAQAKQEREAARIRYEAAANRALAEVERAHRSYQLSREKLLLIQQTVLPKAAANIETAKKSLEAGMTDSLKFLETERGQRAVLIDALETELSARKAWIEVEQAVGYPLHLFPGELPTQQPAPVPLPTPVETPETDAQKPKADTPQEVQQ